MYQGSFHYKVTIANHSSGCTIARVGWDGMDLKAQGLATAAALLLIGAAANAHAATVSTHPASDFTASSSLSSTTTTATTAPWTVAQSPHRTLQWDPKGRWTFRLEMNEPVNHERDWKDVQAGAFFRITPSLRVGGSVGIANSYSQTQTVTPPDAQPRVRLETTFKF